MLLYFCAFYSLSCFPSTLGLAPHIHTPTKIFTSLLLLIGIQPAKLQNYFPFLHATTNGIKTAPYPRWAAALPRSTITLIGQFIPTVRALPHRISFLREVYRLCTVQPCSIHISYVYSEDSFRNGERSRFVFSRESPASLSAFRLSCVPVVVAGRRRPNIACGGATPGLLASTVRLGLELVAASSASGMPTATSPPPATTYSTNNT